MANKKYEVTVIEKRGTCNTPLFEKMATKAMLKVRAGGQGAPGFKKAVLFPKLVFLYDENVHGEGKPLEDLFDAAVECSRHAQYPDYLSLSGNGYIADMYKKYGKVISPMGCRAFLSPYWERGGQHPADGPDARCNGRGRIPEGHPWKGARAGRKGRCAGRFGDGGRGRFIQGGQCGFDRRHGQETGSPQGGLDRYHQGDGAVQIYRYEPQSV